MTTGLSAGSFDEMQLNAGIFCKGLDVSSVTDASALATAIASAKTAGTILGATRGGGTFSCRPTLRTIDADGVRSPFVGAEINDGWDVRLTTTMLEMKPDNFKLALMSADVNEAGKKTTITVRNEIKDSDYIAKICWIGDLKDGRLVLIELTNVLNTNGATLSFRDKGEGTINVELRAHQSSAVDQTTAPCTIIIFDKPDPPQTPT